MGRVPSTWGYPHALLVALVVVLVGAVTFAGATSAATFGSYNPSWDGASQLRSVAGDTGADATTVTNVSEYETADPNRTVAVVLSPDRPYTDREVATLRQFVREGGTLLVAEDFGANGNPLLAGLGSSVRVDGRTLRDQQSYYRGAPLPVAPDVASHPLTAGVDQLTLNYGTTLVPATEGVQSVAATNATVLVNSSEFSYLDTDGDGELDADERLRPRPVAAVERVGAGQVVVVSDPSAFINVMLDRPGNRQFVRTLFATHDRVLLDYSHTASQPPLAAVLLTLRKSSLITALTGAVLLGAVGVWTRYPNVWARIADAVERQSPAEHDAADEDALAAYLERTHPDWNSRRVRRVMAGVLRGQTNDSEDE